MMVNAWSSGSKEWAVMLVSFRENRAKRVFFLSDLCEKSDNSTPSSIPECRRKVKGGTQQAQIWMRNSSLEQTLTVSLYAKSDGCYPLKERIMGLSERFRFFSLAKNRNLTMDTQ